MDGIRGSKFHFLVLVAEQSVQPKVITALMQNQGDKSSYTLWFEKKRDSSLKITYCWINVFLKSPKDYDLLTYVLEVDDISSQ